MTDLGSVGLEPSRRILDERPNMRIALMSGYADDAMEQHGVVIADIALLNKPFTSESLEQALREAFERQGAEPALAFHSHHSFHRKPMTQTSLRILLVDDEEPLRVMLVRLLEGDGHSVVTAPNGVVALGHLEATTFDLVITDVLMPVMEGLEFLLRLRDTPNRPKVLAISGGGRGTPASYLALAVTFGADATLEKPFPPGALMEAIRRLTEPRSPAAATEHASIP